MSYLHRHMDLMNYARAFQKEPHSDPSHSKCRCRSSKHRSIPKPTQIESHATGLQAEMTPVFDRNETLEINFEGETV